MCGRGGVLWIVCICVGTLEVPLDRQTPVYITVLQNKVSRRSRHSELVKYSSCWASYVEYDTT